ncbi:DUF1934 domain-containing protein [Streptococcus sp. zg-JUN1979]|uniref:DUF1934 domain-containing protein n=1 Tax=Streptococcus sp. zg-JUN1979 TaxID=3391450 RepID=UPI0039A67350
MQVTIHNEITFDQETEVIHEVHDCQMIEKGVFSYLTYQNAESEKVILKYNEEELTMTRFSAPKSIMRFHKHQDALVMIPTPLGIQQFMTQTAYYALDKAARTLEISYALTQLDGQTTFAQYRLMISWQ